jgi:hypothetical protein
MCMSLVIMLCRYELKGRVRMHSRRCMDLIKRLYVALKRCTKDHPAIQDTSFSLADVAESIHYF